MKLLANTCLEIFNAMPTAEQEKFLSIVNNQSISFTKQTKKTQPNNALINRITSKILSDHNKRHNNTSRNNESYSNKGG